MLPLLFTHTYRMLADARLLVYRTGDGNDSGVVRKHLGYIMEMLKDSLLGDDEKRGYVAAPRGSGVVRSTGGCAPRRGSRFLLMLTYAQY